MKGTLWISLLTAFLCVVTGPFAAAAPLTVIPANAAWKYLADGSNQGSTWTAVDFNDSTWPTGAAQLGYGDGDEATVLSPGAVTVYFRRKLVLSTIPASATVRLLRDDGAVVYVNGVEVRRDNMPSGPVSFNTLALTAVGGTDETTFFEGSIPTSPFVIGTNVIAVEVHQVNLTSSDLSFALELIADLPAPGPLVTVAAIDDQAREIPPWLDIPEDPAVFRLTRTGPTNNSLNVTIRMSGTASNGVDYDFVSNTVSFQAGSATSDVFIHAIDDTLAEGTETVVLAVVPSPCPECYVVNDSSTATAFILDNEPTNSPPTVNIFAPREGAFFAAPADIRLRATAQDAEDGYGITVDFYEGANKIGAATFFPTLCPLPECPSWELTWSNVPPGNYTLTAKASDTAGAVTVSAPVHITVVPSKPPPTNVTLVSTGSVWKYNDTGADLGVAWREPVYDDSSWAAGPAQLGYGDGDEATVVSYGPDVTAKYITTYFRHQFQVNDAAAVSNLGLRVLRDDGVIVYLNGVEIYRNNMPAGPVTYATLAASVAVDENAYLTASAPASALVSGANVIAAEIHQANGTSSDIGFDLELTGVQSGGTANEPPVVRIVNPTNNSVLIAGDSLFLLSSLHDSDGAAANDKVEIFANTQSLGFAQLTDPGPPHDAAFRFVSSITVPGSYALRARATDERGAVAYSDPVHITVIAPPPTNHPPYVRLNAPLNGASFTAPANIELRAYAQDAEDHFDVTVEFFEGSNLLGTGKWEPSTCPPPYCPYFSLTWSNVPPGTYTLTARATDKTGLTSNSEPATVTVQGPVDSDHDGVPDDQDACPGTVAGQIVNSHGCSIAQLAPCEGPWGSHAEYVRTVIRYAWEFYRHGLISADQRRAIEQRAAMSDCGKHETERVCVHLLPITTVECRDQGLAFLLTGDYTGSCVVETSTDLEHWDTVMTPDGTVTGLELSCPVAHDSAVRFYRVRLTP